MLTTRFVTGAPNWIDVGTPDLDGAASFYGDLFGWRFLPSGPGTGGYGVFERDGRAVAGGMRTTAEQNPPAWTVYFHSPDAAATAEAVERTGGRVLARPSAVTDEGTMALLADKAGVPFGVWQPAAMKGFDLAGEPGSLCRVELHTRDVPAAAAFYAAVFGWETYGVPFPGGTYTTVCPAGAEEDAMFGGLVPLAPTGPGATGRTGEDACWLPYFEVTDADATAARARELGGRVHEPATDVPGVGRPAHLTDPYGARFAVIRTDPERG
ncbi:VOC family protein [Streptomyces sp. NPDC059785]|uniref:VOC family protein n=1 Tax=unclassified Streptomyces TaxID=2593676 RepID=UPI003657B653